MVGKFSENEEKSCHHQKIGDDNPGDGPGIGAEVGGNDRQDDVDDGSVKAVHDNADGDGCQKKLLIERIFYDVHTEGSPKFSDVVLSLPSYSFPSRGSGRIQIST